MNSIRLYYTSGSSDKEYYLEISGRPGFNNWAVTFAYGRRGMAVNTGSKIANTSESKARQTYEKFIKEKVGKGYTVDGSGIPGLTTIEEAIRMAYGDTELTRANGVPEPYQGDLAMRDAEERAGISFNQPRQQSVEPEPEPEPDMVEAAPARRILWAGRPRPQVIVPTPVTEPGPIEGVVLSQQPNPIDAAEAERLLDDPDWGMQNKFDGKKVTVRIRNGQGQAFNKKGKPIQIPEPVMTSLISCGDDIDVDGELIGNRRYVIYDLLYFGCDLRHLSYANRYEILTHADDEYKLLIFRGISIEISELWIGRRLKRTKFEELKRNRAEGVVFKCLGSTFTPGRPSSGGAILKHKFYAACSCITAEGREGKRSVALILRQLDPHGGHVSMGVGNVTIPANHEVPEPGTVVEIRYLYAYRGGSLYQPVYLGPRDDVDPEECLMTQLKYKAEEQ